MRDVTYRHRTGSSGNSFRHDRSDSYTVHNRYSATVASSTDLCAVDQGTAAEISAGSDDAAVRVCAGAAKRSFVVAATLDDSDRHADVAAAPTAGCANDRFGCSGCCSKFPDFVAFAGPSLCFSVAVVAGPRFADRFVESAVFVPDAVADRAVVDHAAAANAGRVPATDGSDPAVVAASAALALESLEFAAAFVVLSAAGAPDFAVDFVVAGVAAPSAALCPGCRAVVVAVAARSVAAVPDFVRPVVVAVAGNAATDQSVFAEAEQLVGRPDAPAAPVDVVLVAPDSVDSVLHPDHVAPVHSRRWQPSTDPRIKLLKSLGL